MRKVNQLIGIGERVTREVVHLRMNYDALVVPTERPRCPLVRMLHKKIRDNKMLEGGG